MDENETYFDHISNGQQGSAQPTAPMPVQRTVSEGMKAGVGGGREPGRRGQKTPGNGSFLGGLIAGLAVSILIVAVSSIFVILYSSGKAKSNRENGTVVLGGDSAIDASVVEKLQTLEQIVENYYYLGEVTEEEFHDGIYKGMMQALKDPYSEYYSAEELNALLEQTEGVYYGIGAYVSLDILTGLPKISGTIAGSPAEAADLRANDLIYEVDGTSTYGLSLTETVALIKGKEGTDVTLTIIREDETDYLHFTLTRRRVEAPTVEMEMLEDNMAYIRITEFDEISIDQFADALATAKGSGMEGLILDLRDNPGGSLNAVVEMARMILPEGMIVYTEDKAGKRDEFTCDGKRQLDVPLVVLINMNSASASEIMAGAVKDYGIGTLVGTTTFGKGIVQQVMPFKDGSAVKITISAYYTPNGNNIHEIGVEPDVECEFDAEAYYGSEEHPDNQLEKAKEVLGELMGR